MKLKKSSLIVIFSILSLLTVLAIAVLLNVISIEELPSSFIGAILGAAITGVITLVLLQGQTEAQEVKERNVSVFNKKSRIFQKYIESVWKIWEDQKVSSEEYKILTSGYYRDLMIYLDDDKLFKTEQKLPSQIPSEVIADCLTIIGECLDKTDYNTYEKLRDNISLIINVLSDQVGLGGKIKPDIIKKHDEKIWPVMFRKELLDAFNEIDPVKDGILEKGQWVQWKWKNQTFHDAISFRFIDYPACTLRYDIVWDIHDKNRGFRPKIMIPVSYKNFDNFRVKQTWRGKTVYKEYLLFSGDVDLFTATSEDDTCKIPAFCFRETEENSIKYIRENFPQSKAEIAEILAGRAAENFEELRIDDMPIQQFLEKYSK